jgi:hypothetical protein
MRPAVHNSYGGGLHVGITSAGKPASATRLSTGVWRWVRTQRRVRNDAGNEGRARRTTKSGTGRAHTAVPGWGGVW